MHIAITIVCAFLQDYDKAKEIFDRMIAADEKKRLEVQIASAAESNRFTHGFMFEVRGVDMICTRWKSVSNLRARLVRLYVNSISRPILTTLGVSFRPPRFRIGDTVKHKGLGYRW